MKKTFLILAFVCFIYHVQAQKYQVKTIIGPNMRAYEMVTNDPLNARIYTLSNGLKVYMSVYKNAPRIQTYIAVKAGSKNDPANATGLAHYLEHMLFKGTSKIGAINWNLERPLLLEIEKKYEIYRKTTDEVQRKRIYKTIDSLSLIAAKYAIANEYDKMLSGLGATGTNAYTWVDQTVYVNDIPSNEIERWAQIEAERFGELVPRLFHTELEAVYEEKNRSLDNDMSKVFEATFAELFPNHPYGTQTTIGTVEHLKNPSIREIKRFFKKYYTPDNMAICMSGDFNPDEAIEIIDKYWNKRDDREKMKRERIEKSGRSDSLSAPHNRKRPERPDAKRPRERDEKIYDDVPITTPKERIIYGPSQELILLGFKFPGAAHPDVTTMELFSKILSNGKAGVLDLNLIQKQKILGAVVYPFSMKDYSVILIVGYPTEGQTLEQTKELLLAQIDSIKAGKFDESLIKAVINNERIELLKSLESNAARADAFVDVFINDIPYTQYLSSIDAMEKIGKADIVNFANKYFGNNYVAVFKRNGTDTTIKKIEKPLISPVDVNREIKSTFYERIMNASPKPITPLFIDYSKDLSTLKLKNDITLLYKQNVENQLFEQYYSFEIGTETSPKLALALNYLDYLGTSKMTAEQLKTEFYKLGCDFNISIGGEKTTIALSGLQENYTKALTLLENLLKDPKPDNEALEKLVTNILKARQDAKLDKGTILRGAMVNYAKFGEKSPFTNILPKDTLTTIKPAELIELVKSLNSYKHKILYYGPEKEKSLVQTLNQIHRSDSKPKQISTTGFKELNFEKNEVYWVDYDMVQAELVILSKAGKFDSTQLSIASLYNEYFGGGMGSIVFQEIRESKALAYSARSNFAITKDPKYSNYNVAYIGTQADKLPEALKAMYQLLDSIPVSIQLFNASKDAILNNIRTQRITKSAVLFDYENNQKLGLQTDQRKYAFEKLPNTTIKDLTTFHEKNVKAGFRKILVIGAKDKLNFDELKKYGEVKQLTLEQIFGY
jgi:predicted Zn-dependent peptidase